MCEGPVTPRPHDEFARRVRVICDAMNRMPQNAVKAAIETR